MIKPGDKVHVEFTVASVNHNDITVYRECFSHDTGITKGYRINHSIDYNHPAIIKSWTPVREPQVGNVYVRASSGFRWTIVHIDGDFAWVKDQANKSYIWPLSSFQGDSLQLWSESK